MSDPKATANTATANRGIGTKLSDKDELIDVVAESELFASDPQYIDNRIQAVGWGLQLGASCLLYVGLDRPIFLPAAYINWSIIDATAATRALYPSRENALASIAGKPGNWLAYYRTVGGVIAPTVFAPASTPRILTTLLNARKQLADEAKEIFTALAVSMIAGQLIRFGFGVLQRAAAWTRRTSTGSRRGSKCQHRRRLHGAPAGANPILRKESPRRGVPHRHKREPGSTRLLKLQ